MTPFPNPAASPRKAAVPIAPPAGPASVVALDDASRSRAEDSWENEGGHLSSRKPKVVSLTPSASEIDKLEAQVNISASKLVNDFASGRVGIRYNTYAHRARVLRLQRAELAAMRARLYESEQSQ